MRHKEKTVDDMDEEAKLIKMKRENVKVKLSRNY